MKQLQAIGNIGNDAVSKEINGETLINFSIAVNRKAKDGTEITEWIGVVSKQVNLLPYLKKSTKVFVQGYFKIGNYQNKDGQYIPTVTVYPNTGEIQLLSAKVESE